MGKTFDQSQKVSASHFVHRRASGENVRQSIKGERFSLCSQGKEWGKTFDRSEEREGAQGLRFSTGHFIERLIQQRNRACVHALSNFKRLARNLVRLRAVVKTMRQPTFSQHICILAALLRPFDAAINQLFKRSQRVATLAVLGQSHPGWADAAQRSKSRFLEVVSGDFGRSMLAAYAAMLGDALPSSLQAGG